MLFGVILKKFQILKLFFSEIWNACRVLFPIRRIFFGKDLLLFLIKKILLVKNNGKSLPKKFSKWERIPHGLKHFKKMNSPDEKDILMSLSLKYDKQMENYVRLKISIYKHFRFIKANRLLDFATFLFQFRISKEDCLLSPTSGMNYFSWYFQKIWIPHLNTSDHFNLFLVETTCKFFFCFFPLANLWKSFTF